MSIEDWDNPQLNVKLLQAVESAIEQCEHLYEGKARSFAVVLNDLESVHRLLSAKLNTQALDAADSTGQQQIIVEQDDLASDQRLVYVRIFHRGMSSLSTGQGSMTWVKPLLDSVKSAEKHGLAIYEHEEEAQKSLKNDNYSYLTVAVKNTQDITHERPEKYDTHIGCRLLTITDIQLADIIKLTHNGVDYPIKDGVIRRINPPKQEGES